MVAGMTTTDEPIKDQDWTIAGDIVTGKGDGRFELRGLQADLNLYAAKLGFEPVKIDGQLGPKSVAAIAAIIRAVVATDPTQVLTVLTAPSTAAELAHTAPRTRAWLHSTAAKTLKVTTLRVFQRGDGKDWNVKGAIAYGAGPVHQTFIDLQRSLNRFAPACDFATLDVDGFIGPATAKAVHQVYALAIAKNPLAAMTLFPVPDTKEEAAAYAGLIHAWLDEVAAKALLAGAGA